MLYLINVFMSFARSVVREYITKECSHARFKMRDLAENVSILPLLETFKKLLGNVKDNPKRTMDLLATHKLIIFLVARLWME
jgi:hypothetical protein